MKGGQESQVAQAESLVDGGNRSTCKGSNGSVVLDHQATFDAFRSVELNGTGCAGTDDNITRDGCAISQSGGISSTVDGGSCLRANGSGCSS